MQAIARRVRFVACMALAVTLTGGVSAGVAVYMLDQKDREIAALREEARNEAEALGTQLAQAWVERERAEHRATSRGLTLADFQDRVTALVADRVAAVAAVEEQKTQMLAERDAAVERAAAGEANRAAELASAIERSEKLRDAALVERDGAVAERDSAAAERERAVAERDASVAERDATVAAADKALRQLDADTRRTVADVERIILATGVAVGRLEPNRRLVGGRGGPYIPSKEPGSAASAAGAVPPQAVRQQVDRLKALHDAMVRLPLVAPVTRAILSDGFGYRYDPINGGGAQHEGLDLRSAGDQTVYAPSTGTVIFVGWNGAFGNMVEIDHGFGITSRYAHLSSMLVRKGDVVGERDRIGVIGATGRVTGAHLHYEIRLDGAPLNPSKFISAVPSVADAFSGFVPR